MLLSIALALAACTTPKSPPAVTPAPKPAPAAPAPKPAWKPAKVVPDAVAVPGGRLHTVKRGETGIAIAQAYGVPWSKVVAANKLKPPYALEVGQKLMLPSTKAAAAATANMTVEQRAAAFSVNIDDLITGSAPAEKPVTSAPRKPAKAR